MMFRRQISELTAWRTGYGLGDLRGDLLGGLTAGSVVLPVAMGYGILSGLGPAAGIYGAIAVGIFGSVLGGTRSMVYGPNILVAIVMSVVVSEYADSLAEAATIGTLAGLIQIAFGILKLGRYAEYIPYSLISGFFSAFGFLVVVKQIPWALGTTSSGGDVIDAVLSWPDLAADANLAAVALAVICVAMGVLWRGRLEKLAPAPFAALVIGTLAGALWLTDAPTIGEIPVGLPTPGFSEFSIGFFVEALQPAFIMALLSSVATLITALRLDAITGAQHQPNREMAAQGIGNIAAGIMGGMAGSVAQGTFVNAYSGGRSPIAGLTVVALLLGVVLVLAPLAERVPFAVLAGVLIVNGWTIIDWRFVKRLHVVPRNYALVMLLTAVLVLLVDITSAILIGLVAAGFTAARRQEKLEISKLVSVPLLDNVVLRNGDSDLQEEGCFEAATGLMVFPDQVTVASAREVSRRIKPEISSYDVLIFDMSKTMFVDDSAAVAIGGLIQAALSRQPDRFVICGMNEEVAQTFNSLNLLDRVPAGRIVSDMEEAKASARNLLLEKGLKGA